MAFKLCAVSVASLLFMMSYLAFYCDATAKPPSYITQRRPFCYGGLPGIPGVPGPAGTHGKPGSQGVPGRDGREGAKGDQGSPGKTGPQGPPGSKGTSGINGKDGAEGKTGAQGPPGQKGQRGESGMPGTTGAMAYRNWKECAWKNVNDGKDNGLIKECVFFKNFTDTSLHVYWTGDFRIYGCDRCCKRWYFTFNGAECSGPLPIDGNLYLRSGKNQDLHRVRHIEGHCNNIHKGKVRVGFWVGNCAGYGSADAYSGWNSVSRIFVEEVPKPQA